MRHSHMTCCDVIVHVHSFLIGVVQPPFCHIKMAAGSKLGTRQHKSLLKIQFPIWLAPQSHVCCQSGSVLLTGGPALNSTSVMKGSPSRG